MTATALRTSINENLGLLNMENLRKVSTFVESLTQKYEKTTTNKTRNNKKRETTEKKLKLIDKMTGIAEITDEEIRNDERLAYILRNNL